VINPYRAFDHTESVSLLYQPDYIPPSQTLRSSSLITIVCLQYLFVTAAIGNIFYLPYEISVKVVISWAMETEYLPFLWISLAVLLPVGGALIISLRVKFAVADNPTG
jgi:hypothetical protein